MISTPYQDWKDGEITHSDYRHMSEDYEQQANRLQMIPDNLLAERDELENGVDTENPFLTAFRLVDIFQSVWWSGSNTKGLKHWAIHILNPSISQLNLTKIRSD